ncbi:MAG: peptidoglycan D,D-transpeptidase FtsI family protein [Planctomycetota bacterium]|jgi:cell division protein FtsI (penicillin-binding protein 3)
MTSAPSFSPAEYGAEPSEHRTNRAISTPFEPGSVAKPLFAAAAVDTGELDYDSLIDCEGGVYHARRGGRISDHGSSYGRISLADVVVYSSNIGMAKVGEHLGNGRLYAAARRFGFGTRTDVGLPGESGGIVRPADVWDGYSMRRVPFGQEISVTPLQLAMGFSALANGGLLLKPMLVDHVRDSAGNVVWRQEPTVVRRVLSPRAAADTLEVLRQVVERGTGKACQLDGWSSFGKTGTAQIPGRGGYVDGAYTGTFIGGGPVGAPRAICLISIYWPDRAKGYYGSTVAAPYVRRVLQRTLSYLGVPQDEPTVYAGR